MGTLMKNSCDGIYSSSLDVRFGKQCDNACPFCIERSGICGQSVNVDALVASTLASGRKDVLILGGEPFLLIDQLLKYVEGIREHVYHIYITTSLPATITKEWDAFSRIAALVDGLNVSLQHWDNEVNNECLHASSQHDRMAILARICADPEIAAKVRVSCNLVRDYVDNLADVKIFATKMTHIGVQHIKFNELQHAEYKYVSFEEIVKNVPHKKNAFKSPYAHGCQYDLALGDVPCLDIFLQSMRITLKRACFVVEQSNSATLADFAKVLTKKIIRCSGMCKVLYEDGTLSNGWQSKK